MKYFLLTLTIFQFLSFSKTQSLNLWEYSLIGSGVGLVFNQYYDTSLNLKNTYSNKINILSEYEQNSKIIVDNKYFSRLPIQQKLNLIEALNHN